MSSTVSAPVAIVTGAASGIGRATARRLASRHLLVVGVDIDESGLEQTAVAIAAEGGRFVALRADVSDDTECARIVHHTLQHGRLTVLCNVAGISPYDQSVLEATPEQWERVLAVNVGSVFFMTRHAAPSMAASGGGVIVNTASVHAFATQRGCAPYAASKGAIVALTRQLALELVGDGIRVVAVAPGSVDTPMSHAAVQQVGSSLAEMGFSSDPRAAGRVGSADEVAAVIDFLASDAASFVNGTTVVADGALLASLTMGSNS